MQGQHGINFLEDFHINFGLPFTYKTNKIITILIFHLENIIGFSVLDYSVDSIQSSLLIFATIIYERNHFSFIYSIYFFMYVILLCFQNVFFFYLKMIQTNSSWSTISNYQLYSQVENLIIFFVTEKNNNRPHHIRLDWILKWRNSLKLCLFAEYELLHRFGLQIFSRWPPGLMEW